MQLAAETCYLAMHQVLIWRTLSQLKSHAGSPAEVEMGVKVADFFTEISTKERRMPSQGPSMRDGDLCSSLFLQRW